MSLPIKHRMLSGDTTFNYLLFDRLRAFDAFVDQVSQSLNAHHRGILQGIHAHTQSLIEAGSDWYGLPVPQNIDELNGHDTFSGMELLKEIRPRIRQYLSEYLRYLEEAVMPLPRLSYNDRGLGLFSFDRAAMGLYRLSEVRLNGPLERTTTQLNIELGRDRLQSRIKKVYAYFEHKEQHWPAIRLYLMAGANADVKGDQLLYVGVACAELVTFLEARGVAVEVNVLIGSAFQGQVCLASVRVKRFEDPADLNRLLLLSSDPRYFRYRGFKALTALSNHLGLTIPEGLGKLEAHMGQQFVTALNGPSETSVRPFVFEQSYSLEQAAREVQRIVTRIAPKRAP